MVVDLNLHKTPPLKNPEPVVVRLQGETIHSFIQVIKSSTRRWLDTCNSVETSSFATVIGVKIYDNIAVSTICAVPNAVFTSRAVRN